MKLKRKTILILVLVFLVGFLLGRMTYSPYSFGAVDWEKTIEHHVKQTKAYTSLNALLEEAEYEIWKLKEEK